MEWNQKMLYTGILDLFNTIKGVFYDKGETISGNGKNVHMG